MKHERRVALLLFVALTLSGRAVLPDPPPYPRFKITNRLTLPVLCNHCVASYRPASNAFEHRTAALYGVIAPGQSIERQLPDRVLHGMVIGTPPFVSFSYKQSSIVINDGRWGYWGTTLGFNACGGNLESPMNKFASYEGGCILVVCQAGDGSNVSAQDYLDCSIQK